MNYLKEGRLGEKVFRGAAILSAARVAGYGLSLVRNLILARTLSKSDFGLAAIFWSMLTLLDWTNRLSLGQQVIQSKLGDTLSFKGNCHALQFLFGIMCAFFLLILSKPVALLLKLPENTWAFSLLAILPLINGFSNLDCFAQQRKMNYAPTVWCDVVPQLVITLSAYPLAILLNDFRVLLYLEIAKVSMGVMLTQILSETPYRWEWKREYQVAILAFSCPLLLNGLLVFASEQGDRMIIGTVFSLSELGAYYIAFNLCTIPFFIFGQVGSSLMLPTLAKLQDDPNEFEPWYRRCVELSVLGGLFLLGPLVVVGGPIVRVLYGPKYDGVGALTAMFATMVALRFYRWAPGVASMARADTMNIFFGNIARAASLPLALLAVWLGTRNLVVVAACGIVGEMVSILVTVLRIRRRFAIGLAIHARSFVVLVGWLALGVTGQRLLGDNVCMPAAILAVFGIWAGGTICALFIFPNLGAMIRQCFRWFRISASFRRQ